MLQVVYSMWPELGLVLKHTVTCFCDERECFQLRMVSRGDLIATLVNVTGERPVLAGPQSAAVLVSLAAQGHSAGVAAFASRCRCSEWDVRAEALKSLKSLKKDVLEAAHELRHDAVPLVVAAIADPDLDVRSAAIAVLPHLGGPEGASAAIETAALLAESQDVALRRTAVQTLSIVALPGNRQAISVLGKLLEDDADDIRAAVVKALPQAAEKAGHGFGGTQAIAEATARLDHFQDSVRVAAAAALAEIPDAQGDQNVVKMLAKRADDCNCRVRQVFIETIGRLATCSDNFAIETVIGSLDDYDNLVRAAGANALGQVAESKGWSVAQNVVHLLGDDDEDVREAAVSSLAQIAERADERALQLIAPLLQDKDWQVRRAALRAIVHVAAPGDQMVVTAVSALLKDADSDVQDTAVELLHIMQKEAGIDHIAKAPLNSGRGYSHNLRVIACPLIIALLAVALSIFTKLTLWSPSR